MAKESCQTERVLEGGKRKLTEAARHHLSSMDKKIEKWTGGERNGNRNHFNFLFHKMKASTANFLLSLPSIHFFPIQYTFSASSARFFIYIFFFRNSAQ